MRALNDNHVVCLLADRDLQGGGPEVEFFGERTTMPAGPATLGAADRGTDPAHRCLLHRAASTGTTPGCGHRLTVERVEKRLRDDVQRITQDLAHDLEILIRRAPSQWHMFQPNWPSDPGYEQLPRG